MRSDPLGFVMKNGPQTQVAFERAERFLDVAELHVTTPDQFRIVGREIGPWQIAAFAAEIKMVAVRQRGALRGVRLVVYESVCAHIHRAAARGQR